MGFKENSEKLRRVQSRKGLLCEFTNNIAKVFQFVTLEFLLICQARPRVLGAAGQLNR